jgi:hypothetical protein
MLLGDLRSVIQDSLAGMCHNLRVSTLCVLWKLRCKYVLENEVRYLVAFCQLLRDEVRMQLLAKGSLLIKDAKLLDQASYSTFIAVLVALRKRI